MQKDGFLTTRLDCCLYQHNAALAGFSWQIDDHGFSQIFALSGDLNAIFVEHTPSKIPRQAAGAVHRYSARLCEPNHRKTNEVAYAASKVSDLPGHLLSLIRVLAVQTALKDVLSYPLSAHQ